MPDATHHRTAAHTPLIPRVWESNIGPTPPVGRKLSDRCIAHLPGPRALKPFLQCLEH
jgi:hypothetical protein